jgi:hypothetical protein
MPTSIGASRSGHSPPSRSEPELHRRPHPVARAVGEVEAFPLAAQLEVVAETQERAGAGHQVGAFLRALDRARDGDQGRVLVPPERADLAEQRNPPERQAADDGGRVAGGLGVEPGVGRLEAAALAAEVVVGGLDRQVAAQPEAGEELVAVAGGVRVLEELVPERPALDLRSQPAAEVDLDRLGERGVSQNVRASISGFRRCSMVQPPVPRRPPRRRAAPLGRRLRKDLTSPSLER